MKVREIILEAAYDGMVVAMKKAFPESVSDIDAQVKWAKSSLKKADRVVWYLKIVRAKLVDMRDGTNTADALYGYSNGEELATLQNNLLHYYGFNSPEIERYTFGSQTVEKIFSDFSSFEEKWKANKDVTKPVIPEEGDYELIKFPDGSAWWFVDRGYCSEEGRSGGHCGNVNGQYDTDERILSYRIGGHVVLTFILHPDGYLGEMKAKSNQKPAGKYHNVIMSLLLSDIVKGIRGAGWGPEFNFSIFDLNDRDLNVIMANKPTFVSDQITVSPIEFLKSPDSVRSNPEYQRIAVGAMPDIAPLLKGNSNENWEEAINRNRELIIHAPNTLKDFKQRVVYELSRNTRLILQAPRTISRDPELLKEVIKNKPSAFTHIVPTTPKYKELAELAVQLDGNLVSYLSDELKIYDMYLMAVQAKSNLYLNHVPNEFRDHKLSLAAIQRNIENLYFVIDTNLFTQQEIRDRVKENSEWLKLLEYNDRDYKLCLEALSNSPTEKILKIIPEYFWQEKEMHKIIISNKLLSYNTISRAPDHMKIQMIQKDPRYYFEIDNPSELVTDACIRNIDSTDRTKNDDNTRMLSKLSSRLTPKTAYTFVNHHGWLEMLRPELVTPKIEIAAIEHEYKTFPSWLLSIHNRLYFKLKSPLAKKHFAIRQGDYIVNYLKRGGDGRGLPKINKDTFDIIFNDYVTELHVNSRDVRKRSWISSNFDKLINLYTGYLTSNQVDTLKKLASENKLVVDEMPNNKNLIVPNAPVDNDEVSRVKELSEKLSR